MCRVGLISNKFYLFAYRPGQMATIWRSALVPKKGKDRGRSWLSNAPWIILITLFLASLWWIFARDSGGIELKYGDFLQVVKAAKNNPAISLQKVTVSHN